MSMTKNVARFSTRQCRLCSRNFRLVVRVLSAGRLFWLGDLQVLPYGVPERCLVGYYPECNVLVPLWHHAKESKVPAGKSVPVRVELQHQAP